METRNRIKRKLKTSGEVFFFFILFSYSFERANTLKFISSSYLNLEIGNALSNLVRYICTRALFVPKNRPRMDLHTHTHIHTVSKLTFYLYGNFLYDHAARTPRTICPPFHLSPRVNSVNPTTESDLIFAHTYTTCIYFVSSLMRKKKKKTRFIYSISSSQLSLPLHHFISATKKKKSPSYAIKEFRVAVGFTELKNSWSI